jgi:hypothetical protein
LKQLSRSDLGAAATYIAGGGLAGLALGLDHFFPGYSSQINSASLIVVAIAGLVRTVTNPTPTNIVQVYDRNTGSTVTMKTVDPPTDIPASPPVYKANASPATKE